MKWVNQHRQIADVIKQAQWEIALECFEQEVEKEKARIRAARAWFPWRIKLVNINN